IRVLDLELPFQIHVRFRRIAGAPAEPVGWLPHHTQRVGRPYGFLQVQAHRTYVIERAHVTTTQCQPGLQRLIAALAVERILKHFCDTNEHVWCPHGWLCRETETRQRETGTTRPCVI